MNSATVAIAKLAGIGRAVKAALDAGARGDAYCDAYCDAYGADLVGHYFDQASTLQQTLQREVPDLYGDFVSFSTRPPGEPVDKPYYPRSRLEKLTRSIDQILQIWVDTGGPGVTGSVAHDLHRVFIAHGRSKDWLEVQACIEKDLEIQTMELGQEASSGKTVIEKVEAGSEQCDSAVIVMTATTPIPKAWCEPART